MTAGRFQYDLTDLYNKLKLALEMRHSFVLVFASVFRRPQCILRAISYPRCAFSIPYLGKPFAMLPSESLRHLSLGKHPLYDNISHPKIIRCHAADPPRTTASPPIRSQGETPPEAALSATCIRSKEGGALMNLIMNFIDFRKSQN